MGLNREGHQEREGNETKIGPILRLIESVHSFRIRRFSLRSLRMWPFGELYLQQVTLAAGTNQEG